MCYPKLTYGFFQKKSIVDLHPSKPFSCDGELLNFVTCLPELSEINFYFLVITIGTISIGVNFLGAN